MKCRKKNVYITLVPLVVTSFLLITLQYYNSQTKPGLTRVRLKVESCHLTHSSLLGRKASHSIDMTYQPEFHEIAAENPKLSTGGRYFPSECRARYRVAIIIPLRGRETQLRCLLSHMHPIWQRQQIEYTVYLVTQSGNELFNRAKLMNIGFVEANKDRKFDCYVFHDVDIFLENDKCSYWCPRNKSEVVHISAYLDKNHYALKYYSIGCFPSEYPSNITYNFGGVTILTHDQFINVNGFSNIFWGWGGEDDDMALRVWKEGYAIRRDPECLTQMWKHDKAKTNETNFLRRRIHDSAFKRQHHEGLNNLKYTVLSRKLTNIFTNITVDVGSPSDKLMMMFADPTQRKTCDGDVFKDPDIW